MSKLPQNKVLHMTQLPYSPNKYMNISSKQIYVNAIIALIKKSRLLIIYSLSKAPLAFFVCLTLMKYFCVYSNYSSDSVLLKISMISPSLSFRNTCWSFHLFMFASLVEVV